MKPLLQLASELAGRDCTSGVLVTPREATSNSVALLVLNERDGVPELVVKVSRLPDGEEAIAHEAANLREIQQRRRMSSVPAMVAVEQLGRHLILIETALVGDTIDPTELRRHPRRCVDDVLCWLLDLPRAAEPPAYEELIEQPLRRLAMVLPSGAPEAALVERTLEAAAPLAEAELPSVVEHGDLSHPNLLRLRDGGIGVVDWELSEVDGLPATDLAFFLGYLALTVQRLRSPKRRAVAFDRAFVAPDGWARPPLIAYARRTGIDTTLLPLLLVVTWARYCARLPARVQGITVEFPDDGTRAADTRISTAALAALRASPHLALWERALYALPATSWR